MNSLSGKPHSEVAVITRTQDRPALLKRAIESVLGQESFSRWIHVIVNDAGNPEAVEKTVAPYREAYGDRLLCLHLKHSHGMENASNQGIAACRSRYIAIHDDDDSWDPAFLQEMTSFLDREDSAPFGGVVCHSQRIVEKVDNEEVTPLQSHPFNPELNAVTLWRLLQENAFPPISFLFKREIFDRVGPFNCKLPVLGDWEFNLRFLQQAPIAVLHRMLANYHHRAPTGTIGYANSVTGGDERHRAWDHHLRESWKRHGLYNLPTQAGITAQAGFPLLDSQRRLQGLKDSILSLPPIPPIQQ